mmetsp:Transcript_16722/g.31341  ORF Transcript_16722/g.31341 Transcript_16722/m.31341 type:complete len:269 (+) Transcript_16722:727-1533(+)
MKANFPHTLHLMTGSVTPLKFRFTWTRVWLRKVLRSSSDIASVVLPTNSSRWTLSLGSVMTLGAPEVEDIEEGALGSGIPVSSCQVTCFVWIPVYLEGRVIFRYAPMKGMLFKLRRFAASTSERAWAKANLALQRTEQIGWPPLMWGKLGRVRPTRVMAAFRNAINTASVTCSVVLPTKSSLSTLSGCCVLSWRVIGSIGHMPTPPRASGRCGLVAASVELEPDNWGGAEGGGGNWGAEVWAGAGGGSLFCCFNIRSRPRTSSRSRFM